MSGEILQTLGGLGLFLVGMHMLTTGLRGLAGAGLRDFLRRSTATPLKGAAAGAVTTAVVQSSSATTVAAVGFVSAGLMSFQQSLGIIYGANIGTTATGWLVALLGFKLHLGEVLMPVVFLGALMNLFAGPRWAHAGWALAGFGVMFIGIEGLKDGMGAFRDVITPDAFPADTFLGRLKLLAVGIVLTVVTQSSSAGVASALAALAVGAITLPQGAVLVIGMNVGTTFTALIATLGGATAARRTGVSHLVYNLVTGAVAFALLYPLDGVMQPGGAVTRMDPQIALVGFHTAFNVLGLLLFIGVTPGFARLVERLVPERDTGLARALDRQLLSDPGAALDAATAATREIARALAAMIAGGLSPLGKPPGERQLDALREATERTRDYVETIAIAGISDDRLNRRLRLFHILDHLDRMRHRAMQSARMTAAKRDPVLSPQAVFLSETLEAFSEVPEAEFAIRADGTRKALREFRSSHRDSAIRRAAHEAVVPHGLSLELDTARWLQRVSYHLWRIARHLERLSAPEATAPDTELDAIADADD